MASIFGGGDAKRQAQQAREQQQVANNRQLAELNRGSERALLSRRNPRGRRLFADAGSNNLQNNLS